MSPSPRAIAMVPYYGDGAHEHYQSIGAVSSLAQLVGFASIDAARSLLLEIAMEAEPRFDVFVFVDSDIAFHKKDFDALALAAHEEQAIVGGAYLSRMGLDGTQKLVGSPLVHQGMVLKFFDEGMLYPALSLGMGFTAIPRVALEKMVGFHQMEKCHFGIGNIQKTGYPLFQPIVHDGRYWLEDAAFCFRAGQAGVPIFLDTRPVLVHHGRYGYKIPDLRRPLPDSKLEIPVGVIPRHLPASTDGWERLKAEPGDHE